MIAVIRSREGVAIELKSSRGAGMEEVEEDGILRNYDEASNRCKIVNVANNFKPVKPLKGIYSYRVNPNEKISALIVKVRA